MTIDHVTLTLNLSTGNSAVVEDPLAALADLLAEQLVERLRLGADYGNLRDANGNTIGGWTISLDG
jgi:hypothetical protein